MNNLNTIAKNVVQTHFLADFNHFTKYYFKAILFTDETPILIISNIVILFNQI